MGLGPKTRPTDNLTQAERAEAAKTRERIRKRNYKIERRKVDAAAKAEALTEAAARADEIRAAADLLRAVHALMTRPADPYGPFLPVERLGAYTAKPEVLAGLRRYSDLGKGECRWPVGDPARPWFRCCGRQVTQDDIPYCNAHARVAYLPDPPKAGTTPLKARFMARRR